MVLPVPKNDLKDFLNKLKIKIEKKRNTKRLQKKIDYALQKLNTVETHTAPPVATNLENNYMEYINTIRQDITLEEDSGDIQTLQNMLNTELADQSRLAAERQSLTVAMEIERLKRPTSTKSTYEGPQNEYRVFLIVYLGMV
jgi:hypothetical protein